MTIPAGVIANAGEAAALIVGLVQRLSAGTAAEYEAALSAAEAALPGRFDVVQLRIEIERARRRALAAQPPEAGHGDQS